MNYDCSGGEALVMPLKEELQMDPSNYSNRSTLHDENARKCLIESHKLLKHYAKLLNSYDGGHRSIPDELDDWIKRCEVTSDD